ncbi:hypothetical protein DFR50_105183 [Roseiarcus fermentans]|uniref:Uncharacterized protein n=1 Tax=Roseiarcus fermentans TaxID=1473586 RepID=A0A366FR64_9HYPH|nr:hypothetical protein [Roseiarcus fermentans]RBP16540.1 hypothetical protein DFR50_105183 [Roseiarcus fermentans]
MNLISIAAGLLGLVDLVLAAVYFLVPAGGLPSFLPGFEPGGTHIHVTHGIGALVFGLVLLGLAWFSRESKAA